MKINNEDFWKDKKVFISGGTGFIGSHLVKKLQSLGSEVRVYFHINKIHGEGYLGDLCNDNEVGKFHNYLNEYKPDVIFHLAAQPLVNHSKELLVDTLRTNIDGTYNLFLACIGIDSIQSIVHISTDKVYGNLDVITPKEVADGDSHPYNATKLASDILARMFSKSFQLPVIVIRNGNIYGAGDLHWERIVPGFFRSLLENKSPTIRGDGSMLRDYIHVDEIVVGYINAAEYGWGKEEPTILRLGSTRPYSVIDVMDAILQATQKVGSISPIFAPSLDGEIPNQHIVDKKSQELISWYPEIDLVTGIDKTALFYNQYVKEVYGKIS